MLCYDRLCSTLARSALIVSSRTVTRSRSSSTLACGAARDDVCRGGGSTRPQHECEGGGAEACGGRVPAARRRWPSGPAACAPSSASPRRSTCNGTPHDAQMRHSAAGVRSCDVLARRLEDAPLEYVHLPRRGRVQRVEDAASCGGTGVRALGSIGARALILVSSSSSVDSRNLVRSTGSLRFSSCSCCSSFRAMPISRSRRIACEQARRVRGAVSADAPPAPTATHPSLLAVHSGRGCT